MVVGFASIGVNILHSQQGVCHYMGLVYDDDL